MLAGTFPLPSRNNDMSHRETWLGLEQRAKPLVRAGMILLPVEKRQQQVVHLVGILDH